MDKSSSCKIYGLIGYPVKHSLSPLMHNAAFRALNIDAEYRLFEIKPADLEGFLLENIQVKDTQGNTVFTRDICGFNITVPHKLKTKQILEKVFPSTEDTYMVEEGLYYVKLSGAINTVRRENNKLEYLNTDAAGFLESLEKDLRFKPQNKNVLLFGCGGVGRAIIAALSWRESGVKKIYMFDKSDEAMHFTREHFSHFAHLKYKLEFISSHDIPKIISVAHLLINASPVGMQEDDPPLLDKGLLHEGLSIYDVVYNRETRLIKDAKSLGLAAQDGLGMLLRQGVAAFKFWTGKTPPVELMREALKQRSG